MKNINCYDKKYNTNELFLVMILKYGGDVFKDYEMKTEWTFLSFAVASIDEEGKLYNALNEKERFDNIDALNAKIGDEVVQIVDLASNVLNLCEKFVSKKQLYDSMKESGIYFKDCDNKSFKEKTKLKKL